MHSDTFSKSKILKLKFPDVYDVPTKFLCYAEDTFLKVCVRLQSNLFHVWGFRGPFYLEKVWLHQQASASPSVTCLAKPLEA